MPDISVPAVEMRGIVKRFPGVLANDHVDLTVRAGEIHACWARTVPARPP
jgi:ABC-type uncharacterized transport system ATPase subunit